MFCSALYDAVRLCCRTTPCKYPGNRRAANCHARNCRACDNRAYNSARTRPAYNSARDTGAGELVQRSAR
jgi:hypothetical protein